MGFLDNISTQHFKEIGCTYCDAGRTLSFNWKYAIEGKDKTLSRSAASLIPLKNIRSGKMYECKNCHEWWYLDAIEKFIIRKRRTLFCNRKDNTEIGTAPFKGGCPYL